MHWETTSLLLALPKSLTFALLICILKIITYSNGKYLHNSTDHKIPFRPFQWPEQLAFYFHLFHNLSYDTISEYEKLDLLAILIPD